MMTDPAQSIVARSLQRGLAKLKALSAQSLLWNTEPSLSGAADLDGYLLADSCTVEYDERRGVERRIHTARICAPLTETTLSLGSYVFDGSHWWAIRAGPYGKGHSVYDCRRDEVVRSTANRGRED